MSQPVSRGSQLYGPPPPTATAPAYHRDRQPDRQPHRPPAQPHRRRTHLPLVASCEYVDPSPFVPRTSPRASSARAYWMRIGAYWMLIAIRCHARFARPIQAWVMATLTSVLFLLCTHGNFDIVLVHFSRISHAFLGDIPPPSPPWVNELHEIRHTVTSDCKHHPPSDTHGR